MGRRHRRDTRLGAFGVLVGALALLVSCDSDSPSGPENGPGAPTPVSATIEPSGGTLQATAPDGSSLRLSFPEGAVTEPLEVTITPVDPKESHARFRVEPWGVELMRPMSIQLQLPAGTPLDGGALVFSGPQGPVGIPTTVTPATRTASATVMDLGFGGGASALGTMARLQGSAAQYMAGVPALGDGSSGNIEYNPVTCAISMQYLEAARATVRDYYDRYVPEAPEFRDEPILSAANMRMLLGAYEQALAHCQGLLDEQVEELRSLLRQEACEGFGRAVTVAGFWEPTASGDATSDFWSVINLLVVYQAKIVKTEAECGDPVLLEDLVEEPFSRFVEDYGARIDRDGVDVTLWRQAWSGELGSADRLKADAQNFGLIEIDARVDLLLISPILDHLRRAAFHACREDGEQGYLADILNGGGVVGSALWGRLPPEDMLNFTRDDLQEDIQLCGTEVEVRVFDDVPEEIPGRALTMGRGDEVGVYNAVDTTVVHPGGALLLQGTIRALRCVSRTAAPSWSNDELVVRFEGVEVARRTHTNGNFLNSTLDLPMAQMLEAASVPEDAEGPFTLTFHREGGACGGEYGDETAEMLQLTLLLAADGLVRPVCRSSSSSLRFSASHQFDQRELELLTHATPEAFTGNACSFGLEEHFPELSLDRHEAAFEVSGPTEFEVEGEVSGAGNLYHVFDVVGSIDGGPTLRLELTGRQSSSSAVSVEARTEPPFIGNSGVSVLARSIDQVRFEVSQGPIAYDLSGTVAWTRSETGDPEPDHLSPGGAGVGLFGVVDGGPVNVYHYHAAAQDEWQDEWRVQGWLDPGTYLIDLRVESASRSECGGPQGDACSKFRSSSVDVTAVLTLGPG
jgi:hypothetical protein